jgi:hypothetical protein
VVSKEQEVGRLGFADRAGALRAEPAAQSQGIRPLIADAGVRGALSRARVRSYSHKQRDLTLEFDRRDDLSAVVTRVGMHPDLQVEADGYDAAVAAIAVAFFGVEARKAFELLELMANEGGRMDDEDERLNRFCDDMAGGYDTINYCFDAGLLDQREREDGFTIILLDAGREILALAQAIETAKPPKREAGSARKGESAVGNADAPECWSGCDDPECPYTHPSGGPHEHQ